MSAEVGLTEAVVDALHNGLHPDSLSWRDGDADGSDHWIEAEIGEVADAILASDWLAERDARIKADAIAQERAAWVAKIEALEPALCDCREAFGHLTRCRWLKVRALLSSDAEQVSR